MYNMKYSSTCGEADSLLDDAKMEMMQMISGMEGRAADEKDAHTVGIFFYPLLLLSLSFSLHIALFKIDLK